MTFLESPLIEDAKLVLRAATSLSVTKLLLNLTMSSPFLDFLRFLKLFPSSFFLNFSFMVLTISAYEHFGEGFIRIAGGLRREVRARPGPTVLLLGASVQRGFGSESLPLEPNLGKP